MIQNIFRIGFISIGNVGARYIDKGLHHDNDTCRNHVNASNRVQDRLGGGKFGKIPVFRNMTGNAHDFACSGVVVVVVKGYIYDWKIKGPLIGRYKGSRSIRWKEAWCVSFRPLTDRNCW